MTIKTNITTTKPFRLLVAMLFAGLLLPLKADAVGGATLTVSSATVTKGATVTVSVSLDTGGSGAFAYQADLSYSTAYFSSASISMNPGSPFTMDPGASDPDIASGGNIHFTRFYTTAKNYSGPVATITLQSNGVVGTAALNFKGICASPANTSNCSTVVDGSGNQLLTALNNGAVTLTEPAAAAASTGGTPSKTKAVKKVAAAASPATTTPVAAPTATADTVKNKTTAKQVTTHNLTLTVTDQNGKPVQGAKVTLKGVPGTTDANGKVTISGLESGKAQGSVVYRGKSMPVIVNVTSSDELQAVKVSIKTSRSSMLVPAVAVSGTIAIALLAVYMLKRKKPDSFKTVTKPVSPLPQPSREAAKPAEIPKPSPQPPAPEKPAPPASVPRPDRPQDIHEKAMDPGTIVSPSVGN